MVQYIFMILMFLTALFLILLVLVQRGRGGGLAGAFGGMGGQSAFGTKAGDLFTRITMFVAGFWILLCVASIAVLNSEQSKFGSASSTSAFGTTEEGDASTDLSGVGGEGAEDGAGDAGESSTEE